MSNSFVFCSVGCRLCLLALCDVAHAFTKILKNGMKKETLVEGCNIFQSFFVSHSQDVLHCFFVVFFKSRSRKLDVEIAIRGL